MKVLIIGSEGFIGSHLVRHFMGLSIEVTGCDVMPQQSKGYAFFQLQPGTCEVSDIVASAGYDYCVNAAGNGNVNVSVAHPEKDFQANTIFTFQVLEAIRLHAPQCKYLHISSAAVYGNPAVLPVSEQTKLQPISPYGWHKMMSEQICSEYHHLYQIPIAIIRPFSVYGPGLKKQIFWDVFNKAKVAGETIELWGGGEEARDFIYIDDLVGAIALILQHSPMQADIYNIASGEMTLIKDAVQLLLKKLNRDYVIHFNGLTHTGNPLQWQADIERLQSLGFNITVNMEKGLGQLADWMTHQLDLN